MSLKISKKQKKKKKNWYVFHIDDHSPFSSPKFEIFLNFINFELDRFIRDFVLTLIRPLTNRR